MVFAMSRTRLVLVTALTLGDYVLWNSSLDGRHDALAIVAGLSLPPLALAWLWLAALTVARALARGTRAAHLSTRSGAARAGGARAGGARSTALQAELPHRDGAPATPASSRRLAA
jgi:hypothetical protein